MATHWMLARRETPTADESQYAGGRDGAPEGGAGRVVLCGAACVLAGDALHLYQRRSLRHGRRLVSGSAPPLYRPEAPENDEGVSCSAAHRPASPSLPFAALSLRAASFASAPAPATHKEAPGSTAPLMARSAYVRRPSARYLVVRPSPVQRCVVRVDTWRGMRVCSSLLCRCPVSLSE